MISPAALGFDADGTPRSPDYDDVYHSAAGGLPQAQAVFLAGNRLPQRWQGRDHFTILETGFGLGINFLATWQAWRNDPAAPTRLHYLSVEKHPCTVAALAAAHAALPDDSATLAAHLRAHWPVLTPGMHRLEFVDGARSLVLTLALGDATALLPQFVAAADAIYLDGFSPAKNPALWSPALIREIALLAAPGCTVATWSVAGSVRDALTAAGFHVEKFPGFGGKRERLAGELAAGPAEPARSPTPRTAIVIGAGLAGCLTAERLAAHGWAVCLLERRPAPAMETSGNLAAALLPVLSLDDNRLSRLNRAAYLYALRRYRDWLAAGTMRAAFCGVLQIARGNEHADKQRDILARNAFAPDFVRWVEAAEARALCGAEVSDGGWWFAGGGWVHPPSVCAAALQAGGTRIDARFNTRVAQLDYHDGNWIARSDAGDELARAPTVVLAGALDIAELAPAAHLPIFRFRGQVTHFAPIAATANLSAVVCREGYLTPAVDGLHCIGASFQRSADPQRRPEDDLANLARLDSVVPGAGGQVNHAELTARVGFRPVSPDKVPIVGGVYRPDVLPQGRDLSGIARWPGLYVATGYGARGAVWAPLMAELLACELSGEALPLESDLASHVDPARFLARQVREKNLAR